MIADLFDGVDRHDLWGKVALPRQHSAQDISDLYALAAEGGVFCNPAFHEPFGLTLIEAAQAGVTLVATQSGGPSDILPELGFGALIDPYDTASLARGLRDVLTQGDPATGAPYTYHRLSDTAFEVCATLALDPAEARKAAFDQDTIALRANHTLCFIGDRAGSVN